MAKKNKAPVSPTPTFPKGHRVRCGDSLGTVVHVDITPNEYTGGFFETVAVLWDDGWRQDIEVGNLEDGNLTESERNDISARDFARTHD